MKLSHTRANIHWSTGIAFVLVIIFFGLQVHTSVHHGQTIDEAAHIGAGYSYWKTGDFRINLEHPPLMKLLAGFPLLFLDISESVFETGAWESADQWGFGYALLYDSGVSHERILFAARLPLMLFSLLLACLIFKWTKKLFGPVAGILALLLFVFDPNFIAHGGLVTNDVFLAAMFFVTILSFGRYLQQPTRKRLLLVSVFFGLTVLTKFSGVLLLPIFAALFFVKWLHQRSPSHTMPKISWFGVVRFFVVAMMTSAVLTWIFYGFEFRRPLDDPGLKIILENARDKYSSGDYAHEPAPIPTLYPILFDNGVASRTILWTLENVSVPAYSFAKGVGSFVNHQIYGHMGYLHGKMQNGGFVSYFPLAFLWKTPLATLILFGIGLLFAVTSFVRRFGVRSVKSVKQAFFALPFFYILLALPPLLFFLSTLTSKINIGHRHILVIYPFLYVLLAGIIVIPFAKNIRRIFRALIFGMVALSSIVVLLTHPFELSYFNELVGGPRDGYRYLLDSNYDWGQGLPLVGEYMMEHQIDRVYLSYFGNGKPEAYGVNYDPLPFDPDTNTIAQLHGIVVISITHLVTHEENFWLFNYPVKDRIGYNFVVYEF